MNDELKIKIENLPEKPGVYIMHNAEAAVIYVGKAKILKNRVRQYFQSQSNHSVKVRKMVENVEHLDYIITDSEVEALMLECNLIKQYRPYYNILMKDDKSYPYLKLTTSDEYPRLEFTRKRGIDKNKYYGPYVNSYAARKTMEAIKLFYPLKLCNKKVTFGSKTGKVCLNYHLGQCAGVCRGDIDPEIYAGYVADVDAILSKKPEMLVKRLTEQMEKESELLHFEAAGVIKEYIEAVKSLNEEQKISHASLDERDIIAVAFDDKTACVQLFMIRGGKIIRTETKYMRAESEEPQDILSSFMTQYYSSGSYIPREIIVPFEPSESELIDEMLSALRGGNVEIKIPQRGDKKRLLDLAEKNARMNIEVKKSHEERKTKARMSALGETAALLEIEVPIFRIEAYDISNISGSDNVGVMVVFENAARVSSALRRFKIKYIEGQNDVGSMAEVVFRRLSRAKEEIETNTEHPKFLPLPEVIFVDGGLGHVHMIGSVVKDFKYPITVAGLVKDSKHRLRGIIREDGTEIGISQIKSASALLNEISEEVHRAAIGYHQSARSRSMLRTELETIEGIGKKRAAALLKHFGSMKKIKEASVNELAQAPGMNAAAAQKLYRFFHTDTAADPA